MGSITVYCSVRALTNAFRLIKVDLHKHPQGTRFVVLKVMDVLFAKHRDSRVTIHLVRGDTDILHSVKET